MDAGSSCSRSDACGYFSSLVFWKAKPGRTKRPPSPPAYPRLAVLPFESRTPGEENQALSYAISDSLITRLAKLSSVQVTSWTSALRLTERKATLSEIAKLLKVDYILEGSFLKNGRWLSCDRAMYSDGRRKSRLGRRVHQLPWKDIFAMQKQVSEEVVRQVNAQLNSRDRRALASIPRAR